MYKSIKIILLLSLLFSFQFNSTISAQKKTKKKSNNWQLTLGTSSIFDDNILKNSEKYLERFMNREDEGRFHINTYDDLIIQYSIGLSYTHKIFGGEKTVLSANYDHKIYSTNSIKSWNLFKLGIRQNLGKKVSFSFVYTHIPDFYVRHFRDEEWVDYYGYIKEAFQPYSFAKDDYSFWFQHTLFKKTRLRYYLTYMKYFHNEHYTEYDSDNYLIGFRVYQSLNSTFKFNAGYKYIYAKATRVDESPIVPTTEGFVDPTYDEHIYTFGLGINLPNIFKLKNNLTITGNYYRRFYKTDMYFELDPLHSGRFDYNYRVLVNYKINVASNFSISGFYNWLYRVSSSSAEVNQSYISDEKDYKQNLMGIKLVYNLKF